MSKNTKIEKEKARIDQREKALKQELESVSTNLEKSAKSIAIIALISGIVAFILYKILSSLVKSSEQEKSEPEEKPPVQSTPSSFLKGAITERIVAAILGYIGNLIADILKDSGKKAKDS